MVEHLDSVAFKNVLHFIVLHDLIELSLLLVQPKTVNRVNLDPFVNISSLLGYIFIGIISFVIGVNIVEVGHLITSMVGQPCHLVVDQS